MSDPEFHISRDASGEFDIVWDASGFRRIRIPPRWSWIRRCQATIWHEPTEERTGKPVRCAKRAAHIRSTRSESRRHVAAIYMPGGTFNGGTLEWTE